MLAVNGIIWAWFLASAALAAGEPSAPPAAIAGTWEVERVEMDAQDPSRWPLLHNDPRFVGRSFVIEAGRVQLEGDKDLTCQQDTWPAQKSTWPCLFGKGYLRPRVGSHASPTAGDFGVVLPKSPKRSDAVVAQVICPVKGPRAAVFPLNQWAAVAPSGELLVHHDTQVLLVLRRRADNEKPAASFDCSKAATPTEQAICRRSDLASWDRSVGAAVGIAKARDMKHSAEIDAAQVVWIKQRSSCGSDADCIEKIQIARVYELVGE